MVGSKQADYVCWVPSEIKPTGGMIAVQQEMHRLIQIFDAKPIIKPCMESECSNIATHATSH